MKSTQAMRDRIRELMTDPIDDYDRAVLCVLNELEQMLNEPQRSAGKESDVVAELRDRFADAKTKANESAKVALNSYGAGYDLGYHDALGELLEYLTAGVKK